MTKQRLESRLEELRNEHTTGEKLLSEYGRQASENQKKITALQKLLLRIEGAIQVLEEELRNIEREEKEEQ